MEKYGTIPPRFTKDWWSHYWTYYKFHFFAVVFVIVSIVYTAHSCANNTNYDLQIQFITSAQNPSEELIYALDQKVLEVCSDTTGNGKVDASTQVTICAYNEKDIQSAEYYQAILMKLMAEVETGEKQIFIVDKAYADVLTNYECLAPVSEWTDDIPEGALYNDCILSLADNTAFKNLGFDTSDLFIGVLIPRRGIDEDSERYKKHQNSLIVANHLIKE